MHLTADEQAMADGNAGPVLAFAMDLLVKLGEMHGAPRLEAIEAAYVNTTFSWVEPHYDLLCWLAEHDARVAVPTYTNVTIYDPDNPRLRTDKDGLWASERSLELIKLHRRIGCEMTLTCAPYHLPDSPGLGTQISCSESNAVSYFNSVTGARTLKYGDYVDMATALTGRVPFVGLHTDEGRRATVVYDVAPLPDAFANDDLSYQLIGHVMGRKTAMEIPALVGINPAATVENLRSIGACGASAGGVAMFHAVGLTPEAPTLEAATDGVEPKRSETITVEDLITARAELTQFDHGRIDAVVIGTPHAPLAEVKTLASLLDGQQVRDGLPFYIQMSRHVLEQAREHGWIETLREAGVTPVADTCIYWRPRASGLTGRVMTNSGKFAYYAPGELEIEAAIGSLRECVESAVRGQVWRDPALVMP